MSSPDALPETSTGRFNTALESDRNDALGNLAVLSAAAGVFGTGTGWPDVAVAATMSALTLWGGWQIVRHALSDLRIGQFDVFLR